MRRLRNSQSKTSVVLAVISWLLVAACAHTKPPTSASVSAPGLSGEGQLHIRGVSDPNAPFTLIDRTQRAAAQPAQNASEAAPCDASALRVFEVAAENTGDDRLVKLAFVNRGETPCALSGYPSISLLDEAGVPIASITVQQTSSHTFTGSVDSDSAALAADSPITVLLRPGCAASFQVGWVTGEDCPRVSRLQVTAPGSVSTSAAQVEEAFVIDRPLAVCGGKMRVSKLASAQGAS